MKRFAFILVAVCALMVAGVAAKPLLAGPQVPAAGTSSGDSCGIDKYDSKCADKCKCGDDCKCEGNCKCTAKSESKSEDNSKGKCKDRCKGKK